VRSDLLEQPPQLGGAQVRGDAEGREIDVEGRGTDGTEATAQVVTQMGILHARPGRAEVDPEVARQPGPTDAPGQPVGAAEIEQRTAAAGPQQRGHQLREEPFLERAPDLVVAGRAVGVRRCLTWWLGVVGGGR